MLRRLAFSTVVPSSCFSNIARSHMSHVTLASSGHVVTTGRPRCTSAKTRTERRYVTYLILGQPVRSGVEHRSSFFQDPSTMRDAVQTASLRIQQHIQQGSAEDAALLSATSYPVSLRSGVLASTDVQTQISGQDATFPEISLAVQRLKNPDIRGTINIMARLIEQHGLLELQRVGIVSQGKGVYSPRRCCEAAWLM